MIRWRPARPHDLLKLRPPSPLTADTPVPSWVAVSLRELPWVVVRRGQARDGLIPVGVRGSSRPQRFAAFVAASEVAARRAPEDLTHVTTAIDLPRRDEVPALKALTRVAPILQRRGERWGPGGSVGFEIATGAPTATATSDLDLILRQERRLEAGEAGELLTALTEAASPARLDVILETPRGGVSLADLAAAPSRVLVRTPAGPQLCADPWSAAMTATDEGP